MRAQRSRYLQNHYFQIDFGNLGVGIAGLLAFFTELTVIVGIGIRSRLDKPHAPSTIQGDVYEV